MSYATRRHAANAHTCRENVEQWNSRTSGARRRQRTRTSRGVAVQLLERHAWPARQNRFFKRNRPTWHLAQVGRLNRSSTRMEAALTREASDSSRCTKELSWLRTSRTPRNEFRWRDTNDVSLTRGRADRRARARVEAGKACLSRAVELAKHECRHDAGFRAFDFAHLNNKSRHRLSSRCCHRGSRRPYLRIRKRQ